MVCTKKKNGVTIVNRPFYKHPKNYNQLLFVLNRIQTKTNATAEMNTYIWHIHSPTSVYRYFDCCVYGWNCVPHTFQTHKQKRNLKPVKHRATAIKVYLFNGKTKKYSHPFMNI